MNNRRAFKLTSCAVSILVLSLSATSARAAERIRLRFGSIERTIQVDDLDAFVTENRIPKSLDWYAQQLGEERQQQLRSLLRQRLEISPTTVGRVAHSPLGALVLRRASALFPTSNSDSSFKALRASLSLAAFAPDGLTALNAIRHYPLRDLRIEVNRLVETVSELSRQAESRAYLQARIDRVEPKASPAKSAAEWRDLRLPGPLQWRTQILRIPIDARPPAEAAIAELYLPDGLSAPAPLAIISHGLSSNGDTFAYLAKHLASYGFAVATLRHSRPQANSLEQFVSGFNDPEQLDGYLNRPADITHLLDRLEAIATRNPEWHNRLNLRQVGVIGQSLGGYSALAVGGARLDFSYLKQVCESAQQSVFPFNLSTLLQCKFQTVAPPDATFRDRRIAAVLAVNPVGSAVFGPLGLAQIDVPVMVVGGSDDRITPATEEQIYPFTWLQAPEKYLVMVDGGTHFSFLRGRDKGIAALPDRLVGPNPAIAHGYLQALSTAFLQTYLNHRPQYAAYLSDSYLQTLCEDDPFQLTVTRSLGQQQVLRAVNASGSLYLATLVSLTESLVARSPITEWKATILQDRPLAKPPADGQSVKAMVSDQPKAIAATNRRETVAIDPAFSRSHE